MSSAAVLGPLEAVAVMAGAFDDSRVTALAAGRIEVLAAGDVAEDVRGEGGQPVRGKKPQGL
jgi:hypothetical protein